MIAPRQHVSAVILDKIAAKPAKIVACTSDARFIGTLPVVSLQIEVFVAYTVDYKTSAIYSLKTHSIFASFVGFVFNCQYIFMRGKTYVLLVSIYRRSTSPWSFVVSHLQSPDTRSRTRRSQKMSSKLFLVLLIVGLVATTLADHVSVFLSHPD